MKDHTRREFLNTAAKAAVGGMIVGHTAFLNGQALAIPSRDGVCIGACAPLQSLIFPSPQELSGSGSDFVLNDQVSIVVPSNASEQDLFLAHFLVDELGDRFGLYPKIERMASLSPNRRAILMGSMANPLVRQYCTKIEPAANTLRPGPEGYILRSDKNIVLIAGSDDRGTFYGLQSLRQLIVKDENQLRFRGVRIRDWPDKPFRGIYLFLPGRDNIPFFKRFVRDYMALYKYNTLIMEMGSSMRLDSHPELNYGWVQFARDTNYSYRNYPPKPFHDVEQNSSHQDTADGGFLEKEEVADLARWVKQHHIELVPEVASLTHSYFLLAGHRDLAISPGDKWPDTYCPSNPKSYSLVFEVYDEYIDLLKPKMLHIGHDELFVPIGVSPQCSNTDMGEQFGEDVKKVHDYLSSKGIRTALWGDMLLQSVRGSQPKKHVSPDGWTYYSTAGMTPDQVERLIPKDCLIFNWFWHNGSGFGNSAELNEATLDKMGFQQIYGNFHSDIENYETRKKRPTLLGGAPSSWAATNEFNFGKDQMSSFLGCSSILWTGHAIQGKDLSAKVQAMLPEIRVRLSGTIPPSLTESSIVPVDISSRFNMAEIVPALDTDLSGMKTGKVQLNNIPFDLKLAGGKCAIIVGTEGKENTGLPKAVTGITVGESVTSLVFLHASAKRASNKRSFQLIWDQQDTADLLGWYEIVYEDGFVTSIPIRFGVNILDWKWEDRAPLSEDYCYGADALSVGSQTNHPITLFAFEWTNSRLGKVIQEVRLKGTTGFQGGSGEFNNKYGSVIASNAVILKALSVVKKRS